MLLPIDTLDDPRISDYRHIADSPYLRGRSLFVAEGRLVVLRLLALPQWGLHSIFVTRAAADSLGAALDATDAPVYVADQALMNAIAGFDIHRGCLALASRPAARVLDQVLIATTRRILVLEGVNNPDNVGGLFRSAEAFGVDLVVLGPGCGDPLYRKAIRTSMASTLSVPFVAAGAWPAAIDLLSAAGFRVVALTPGQDATPLEGVSGAGAKVALLVGAEGNGLSVAALAAADTRARVAMTTTIDSLNVTTAASIAMYHFFAIAGEPIRPTRPDPPRPAPPAPTTLRPCRSSKMS